jgi:hypothetical protein
MKAAKFFSQLELQDYDAPRIFEFHIEPHLAFME